MNLPDSELASLHDLALEAARCAGAHIRESAGNHGRTKTKEGGDTLASQVVTEIDLESQGLILEALRESIDGYGLGLLTEESEDDSSRFDADYFWCIDPLDGTLPFVEGTPGYSVSIALVSRDGIPQIGMVHDPAANETFHAIRGQGALKNGVSLPSRCDQPNGHHTWLMDRSMKGLGNFPKIKREVERITEVSGLASLELIDHAGAALNGVWVATRPPSIYFKFPKSAKGGGSLWDFAASACVLTEWGCPPTDIFGEPLNLNPTGTTFMNERGVIYASDLRLRKSVQLIYSYFAK